MSALEPDPITRPCEECGAAPGEPCRPFCTAAAQQLELHRAVWDLTPDGPFTLERLP